MLRGLVKVPQPVVKADRETEGSQRAPHRGSDSNTRKKGEENFRIVPCLGAREGVGSTRLQGRRRRRHWFGDSGSKPVSHVNTCLGWTPPPSPPWCGPLYCHGS